MVTSREPFEELPLFGLRRTRLGLAAHLVEIVLRCLRVVELDGVCDD
jgi:hypothetical protein